MNRRAFLATTTTGLAVAACGGRGRHTPAAGATADAGVAKPKPDPIAPLRAYVAPAGIEPAIGFRALPQEPR